jgi:exodeoxyribonuclease VII large subunit
MDRQAFCNPIHTESPNISDSVSPTTLLNMLQIETPKYAVKIRGEVLEIRPWPNRDTPIYLYGEIGDSQSCIEFKIKPNNKLQLHGQHIEIVGVLHTSANYKRDGIKISIEGEMVNEYNVEHLPSKILAHDISRAKLSLKHFLSQYNFNQLCILSTRQGFADFIAKTNQTVHYTDVILSVCNFDSTENIIKGIKETSTNSNIRGIAIIHDGVNCWDNRKWDDTEVVMELLNTKLLIYTALCETDNLLLADKHSDEAFITPNSFAQHLTSLVIENKQKNDLSEKIFNIENKFNDVIDSRSKLRRLVFLLIISNIALLAAFLIRQGIFF